MKTLSTSVCGRRLFWVDTANWLALMVSYFSSSLGLLYMAKLKQMSSCFALVGKKMEQHPLYQKQMMYLEEMETVELNEQ